MVKKVPIGEFKETATLIGTGSHGCSKELQLGQAHRSL